MSATGAAGARENLRQAPFVARHRYTQARMAVEKEPEQPSAIGKFIQTYSSFLSTFVIGAAGLVATSIWQYRQSEIAARQAESQQHIATTQAENNWRIERAEILSKNLGVLSSGGQESAEQRYGVLLSLTRGSLIDAELAVSYALELGKDNPTYMRSVLASTSDKSYGRLANALELTCQQRFGTTRDVPICPTENRVARSLALADLFAEDIDAARRRGERGPLELLIDERSVQASALKLTALFGHYLGDLFERRQFHDIEQFEQLSVGGRLIGSLVLAADQPNAFVAASEAEQIEQFHAKHADFLREYLFGRSCGGDCKGKLVDIMLTSFAEAQGRYDAALRELFTHPRGEVAIGLARLHSRLLQCQVNDLDAAALRDEVLVPALADAATSGREGEGNLFDDLLALLALTPDPGFEDDQAEARRAWEAALAGARKVAEERYDTAFTKRRRSAQATRKNPPAKLKDAMFCTAAEVSLADLALEE
ncbi:MAG TPA: hypothetical protein VG963_32330 [Polyangiaceae bacterium]|nr:hypothetical protein [Polyangiaceae bacterium]